MKKTRPKPYIAEDNSSLLYIIKPESTGRRQVLSLQVEENRPSIKQF